MTFIAGCEPDHGAAGTKNPSAEVGAAPGRREETPP